MLQYLNVWIQCYSCRYYWNIISDNNSSQRQSQIARENSEIKQIDNNYNVELK